MTSLTREQRRSIAIYLNSQGYTAMQIAKHLGVTTGTVDRYLVGAAKPPQDRSVLASHIRSAVPQDTSRLSDDDMMEVVQSAVVSANEHAAFSDEADLDDVEVVEIGPLSYADLSEPDEEELRLMDYLAQKMDRVIESASSTRLVGDDLKDQPDDWYHQRVNLMVEALKNQRDILQHMRIDTIVDAMAAHLYLCSAHELAAEETDRLRSAVCEILPEDTPEAVAHHESARERFVRFCTDAYGTPGHYGRQLRLGMVPTGEPITDEIELQDTAHYAGGNIFTQQEIEKLAENMNERYLGVYREWNNPTPKEYGTFGTPAPAGVS